MPAEVWEVTIRTYYRPLKKWSKTERIETWRKEMESVYLCTAEGLRSLMDSLDARCNQAHMKYTAGEPEPRTWQDLDPLHRHRLQHSPDGCYCVLTTV